MGSGLLEGTLRFSEFGEFHMFDVIIVGAGLSGLHAAAELEKLNVNVAVIEARDRVGGRVYTVSRDGVIADMGRFLSCFVY